MQQHIFIRATATPADLVTRGAVETLLAHTPHAHGREANTGKLKALRATPVTLRKARAFVDDYHPTHAAPQGGLFAIAASTGDTIVGVVIVGRPIARMLCDGYSAEVTRLCTDGQPNARSLLFAAAWRAARAMGYLRLITYTLPGEGYVPLRAAGWRCIGKAGGGTWSRADRPRIDAHPTQQKVRWEAV